MPELPEVETIARWLNGQSDRVVPSGDPVEAKGIKGKTIQDACLLWQRSLATPAVTEFSQRIVGQQVTSVNRRGKFLRICLSQDFLLIHLRMSGDIYLDKQDSIRDGKHDRMVLSFSDQTRMVFNDPRKFGRIWMVKDDRSVLSSLGPEPLDEHLSASDFFTMLTGRQRQIKPLLMDQTFLAGLGNIYTDEALFLAGIHPAVNTSRLTEKQAAELLQSIRQVLSEGIEHNGASIDWVYRGGDFQNWFKVYQRDGQPCERCGTIIRRVVMAQRGTHFCPRCQVIPA